MVEAFVKEGDVNSTFARLAADAPDIKQAEAKLEVAKRDLDEAELDLRYCDVSRGDRWGHYAPKRQPRRQCADWPGSDGDPFTR